MKIAISKKKQRDFVRMRWESILAHFERFANRTNAEHMHKIRVDLKKLRALIYLQEKSGHKVNPKEKSLLKKLFRKAGLVREAQVSGHLIRKSGISSHPVLNAERKQVERRTKDFVKTMKAKTDDIVVLNTEFWRNAKPINEKRVTNILDNLESEIRKALFPRLVTGKLHESRKAMKRYIYIQSLLKKAMRKKYELYVKNLKRIEEAIGKWHDLVNTVEIIQQLGITTAKMQRMRKMKSQQLNVIRKLVKTAA